MGKRQRRRDRAAAKKEANEAINQARALTLVPKSAKGVEYRTSDKGQDYQIKRGDIYFFFDSTKPYREKVYPRSICTTIFPRKWKT